MDKVQKVGLCAQLQAELDVSALFDPGGGRHLHLCIYPDLRSSDRISGLYAGRLHPARVLDRISELRRILRELCFLGSDGEYVPFVYSRIYHRVPAPDHRGAHAQLHEEQEAEQGAADALQRAALHLARRACRYAVSVLRALRAREQHHRECGRGAVLLLPGVRCVPSHVHPFEQLAGLRVELHRVPCGALGRRHGAA